MIKILNEKTTSFLLSQPAKKLPERIVYKKTFLSNAGHMISYKMFDISSEKYAGYMYARPLEETYSSLYYPLGKYNSFKIEYLLPKVRKKGYGSDFINLAKKESKNYNCHGRVHLDASASLDPQNPPHIFYRKKGFTSMFCDQLQYIDNCIKNKKKMDWYKTCDLPMYLPVPQKTNRQPEKKSVLSVCVNYFRSCLSKFI